MSHCVGLFGTCGNSTWRNKFIEAYGNLGISFFNPQVADWSPELAAIEAEHLASDEIILFPVTDETYGTGSLVEIGFAVLNAVTSGRHVVIYVAPTFMDPNPGCHAVRQAEIESNRARKLAIAHASKFNHPNVHIVQSLDEMLAKSIELYHELQA